MSENSSIVELAVAILYKALTKPGGKYYLPSLIAAQSNPRYEPYQIGDWAPPALGVLEEQANAVCVAVDKTRRRVHTPNTKPDLSFSNVSIVGISNVIPEVPAVKGDQITVKANFSTLGPSVAPAPLRLEGDFTLQIDCCPIVNRHPEPSQSAPYEGRGTFTLSIPSSSVTGVVNLSVESGTEKLIITAASLNFEAEAAKLATTVEITSIPPGELRDTWSTYVQNLLNASSAQVELLSNLKKVLGEQSLLNSLSALLTEKANELI